MNDSGISAQSQSPVLKIVGQPLAGRGHETLLRVRQLRKSFGPRLILRDLEFEINTSAEASQQLEPAPILALLGPSGIGKTTLLRILAGLERPTHGAVLLGAEVVRTGQVGLVFQDYPLLPHRTVLGNLCLAARQAGLDRAQAKAQALAQLDVFGLGHHAASYPVRLSGGQRQRVAIAQQFLCQHRILLMDEPFSGLDILAVSQLCRLLQLLAARQDCHLIVIATHHLEAAFKVADVICLLGVDRHLEQGRLPGARFQACYQLPRSVADRDGICRQGFVRQEILQAFANL